LPARIAELNPAAFRILLAERFQPGEILVDIGSVNHHLVTVRSEPVNENIVHHGAVAVAQGGVLGLHVVQLVHIVDRRALKESPGPGSSNKKVTHVGYVEKSRRLAHGLVLLAYAGILHRHDEPREGDHLGIERHMRFVQGGLFSGSHLAPWLVPGRRLSWIPRAPWPLGRGANRCRNILHARRLYKASRQARPEPPQPGREWE